MSATWLAVRSFALIAGIAGAASAQERQETLIDGRMSSGGFGGPVAKMTQIRGEFAVISGARGGWIVNHRFILGAGAYSMSQQGVRTAFTTAGERPELEMNYGGLELEYIHRSNRVAHLSVSVLSGAGEVFYRGHQNTVGLSDEFAVVEPGVGLEVNVTRWLRVVSGASYRFIGGASIPDVTGRDLSGVAGTLTFKFGKF